MLSQGRPLGTSTTAAVIALTTLLFPGRAPAQAAATFPTIKLVANNFGLFPPGFPNSGVAQGSLFVVTGFNLADTSTQPTLQSSSAPGGLPTTLNGASATVTSGSVTTKPVFYYATSTALGMVLPSTTPIGTAQLTITCDGSTSVPFTFQVVESAMGFDSYDESGTGLGVATDAATGILYDYSNAIPPGTNVVLWGSGLGADVARDSSYAPPTGTQIRALAHVYVGGVDAPILYQGPSGFPGLNQVNITIPPGSATGCNVALVGVTDAGMPTNFTSLPIGASACSDTLFGSGENPFEALITRQQLNVGFLSLSRLISSTDGGVPRVTDTGSATFLGNDGVLVSNPGTILTAGSCVANEQSSSDPRYGVAIQMNAGNVALTNPVGTSIALTSIPALPGLYQTTLPSGFIPAAGGTFSFSGSGSLGVGSFKTSIAFPTPTLTWTNQVQTATVSRSNDLPISWAGAAPGSFVVVTGSSSAGQLSGIFTCVAPAEAMQLVVPSYVLQSLPAGTGSISIENQTAYSPFTVTGLDYGYAIGAVVVLSTSTFI